VNVRWAVRGLLAITTLALAVVIVLRLVRADRLPVLGNVPDFSLVEASDRPLRRADLRGRVWVADFIFTHCASICPVMTANLSGAQRALFAQRGLRLVSFSVDPVRDTPAVLADYARRYDADRARWHFVTGSKTDIWTLAHSGFRLTTEAGGSEDTEPILHSPHLVLVDQRGRIRGYYDGTEAAEVKRLIGDAQRLESKLPTVNAALNAGSAVCLAAGYLMIRQKRTTAHAACMIAAVVVSLTFLVCYVTYHAEVGSRPFDGQGGIRSVYYGILLTHTVLAAMVALWLAPVTVYRAARRRFEQHKGIARWTLPVWLYVSVTGVVIYFMLYHWYAA